MCGRFTLTAKAEALSHLFPLFEIPVTEPRYNIAPTQMVAAVRQLSESEKPEFAWLRWGLVPYWTDDISIGNRLLNARAETVAEKPSFRSAFRSRRCLVLADGFYEWQKVKGGKQPYYIRLKEGKPFCFAGLWERWKSDKQELLESCTLITTAANEMMKPIHDRMPVILDPAEFSPWLDPGLKEADRVSQLLRPIPAENMEAYPITTYVNSPKNEGPECIAPLSS
jgi:putative SOS response-associated peptidase YedK